MVEPSETPRNLPVTAVGQSFEVEFSQPSISKNSHSGKNSSKNGKRRLAVTRGFNNSGLPQLNKSSSSCNKIIDPATSNLFTPVAGSTPLNSPSKSVPQRSFQNKLLGISSLVQNFRSKGKKSSNIGSVLPPKKPVVPQPSSSRTNQEQFVRHSVITPVNTPESSLDWDNYLDPDSIRYTEGGFLGRHSSEVLLSEGGDLLDNLRITLVPASDTSHSAISVENMSRFQQQEPHEMEANVRAELQDEMNIACKDLMDMFQSIQDLMEDYTVEDVNVANADRAEVKLKENFRR